MANVRPSDQDQQQQQQRSPVFHTDSPVSPPGGVTALLTSPSPSSYHPPADQPPPPPRVPPALHRSPLCPRAQSVSPQRCFLPRPCPAPPYETPPTLYDSPPPLYPRRVRGANEASRASTSCRVDAIGTRESLSVRDVVVRQPEGCDDELVPAHSSAPAGVLTVLRGCSTEEHRSDAPARIRTSAPPLRGSSELEEDGSAWRRSASDRSVVVAGRVVNGIGSPGSFEGGKTLRSGASGKTLQNGAGGMTLRSGADGMTFQNGASGKTLQSGASGGKTLQSGAGGMTLQYGAAGRTLQDGADGKTFQNGARVLQRSERVEVTENVDALEWQASARARGNLEGTEDRETLSGTHKPLRPRHSHELPRSSHVEAVDSRLRVRRQGMRRGDSDPVERSRLLGQRTSAAGDVHLLGDRFTAGDIMSSSRGSMPQGSQRAVREPRAGLQHVVPLDRWPFNSTQQPSTSQRPQTHFVLDRIARRPTGNEYVDEPTAVHQVEIVENRVNQELSRAAHGQSVNLRDCGEVLTCQPPSSAAPKSLQAAEVAKGEAVVVTAHPDEVVCSRCGLCRCRNCTGRLAGGDVVDDEGAGTDLPSCWLAGGRYECSLQSCMDRVSCVCCLRTLFYHCLYDEDDDVDIVAQPFSCTEAPHCCARWAIIAALAPVMPCLGLYALTEPIRCTLVGCLRCRERCRVRGRQGCRCGQGAEAPSLSTATTSTSSGTTRSLLVDSPEHSSA